MKEKLNDVKAGMSMLAKNNPEEFEKFNQFVGSVLKNGKLDLKTKELIALGVAITVRCSYCIGIHTEKCYKAGATTEEIIEAATVAALMGGGPAMMYMADLKKAIDLFKDKYEKKEAVKNEKRKRNKNREKSPDSLCRRVAGKKPLYLFCLAGKEGGL